MAELRYLMHEEGLVDVRDADSRIARLMESYEGLLDEEAELNSRKKQLRAEIEKEAEGFVCIETPEWTLDYYTRMRMPNFEEWCDLEKVFPGIMEAVEAIRTKPYFRVTATKSDTPCHHKK